jgi:hypothetical protein
MRRRWHFPLRYDSCHYCLRGFKVGFIRENDIPWFLTQ